MEGKKKKYIIIVVIIAVISAVLAGGAILLWNYAGKTIEIVRTYVYSSDTTTIEFILNGEKSGTFSLELVSRESADIYTGEFWSDNTSRNGLHKFNLKGYDPPYFYVFEDYSFLRLSYTNAQNIDEYYTLTLKKST